MLLKKGKFVKEDEFIAGEKAELHLRWDFKISRITPMQERGDSLLEEQGEDGEFPDLAEFEVNIFSLFYLIHRVLR